MPTPELGEVFIIEVENMTCWQPVAFAISEAAAREEMDKRRGTGRFQINFRVRRFIPDTALGVYKDFIRKTLQKSGIKESMIEDVLEEIKTKLFAAAFNISGTKTGRISGKTGCSIIPGTRYFLCKCGHSWRSKCADKNTSSGESCPVCKENTRPTCRGVTSRSPRS